MMVKREVRSLMGDSTIMSLFPTALEMCGFQDEAQAVVGYSRGRGLISTKK